MKKYIDVVSLFLYYFAKKFNNIILYYDKKSGHC